MIFCFFNSSSFASSYPIVASTSFVSAPSSGGARYSFTGVPENVRAIADQRQLMLEGMVDLDLHAARSDMRIGEHLLRNR